MPTFVGFNTINQNKKFTLVDFELIKRDLANALNIQQGEIVGRPGYGTAIWGMMMENQTPETQQGIIAEIQRVAAQDPRIYLESATAFPQDNGILIEIQMRVAPSTTAQQLSLFFDQQTRRATFV